MSTAPVCILVGWLIVTSVQAIELHLVKTYSISTQVTLGGTVVPIREATLSAQLAGRIDLLAGEEGDTFDKGSVLAGLDDQALLAQRRAAFADRMSAEAILRNANVQYSREYWSPNSPNYAAPGGMGLPLIFDKFFSYPFSDFLGQSDSRVDRHAELFASGSRIDQAFGTLFRAQSVLEQVDARLRDSVSKAPFDGVIVQKLVEVGDTVQPGQALIRFADLAYLQVQVDVPARLVPGLNIGMTVPAKLDVLLEPVPARLARIFPTADPQRHTVRVKFDLPVDIRTGPGQYAQIEIQDQSIPPRDRVVIPERALVFRGSLPGVYVLNGEQRNLRLLRLGRSMDHEHVIVLSGLSGGESIELNPAPSSGSEWQ